MFRIRRIYDDILPINRTALREVGQIFREQFSSAPVSDVDQLAERLKNPFLNRFRTILYVAENSRSHVTGFAIVLHEPEIRFCYLDYIAAGKSMSGRGVGYNLNLPLPEVFDGPQYHQALAGALKIVMDFALDLLVVALGLDPAKGDPTGTWSLNAKDFHENGRLLGELHLPTLVVQEGGYRTRTLGINARQFFRGLAASAYQPIP